MEQATAPQKEEITVTVNLTRLEFLQGYIPKASEQFKIDLFLSSSRTFTRQFRFHEGVADFSKRPETLEVKNIGGDKVEIWLSCTFPTRKLIAVATLSLAEEAWEQMVILKLENDEFARLEFNWNVSRRSIERHIFIEPDEVILRKKVDPAEELRKLEEEQRRRLKEQLEREEREMALKKRPIITLTTQNKKEQPYI